MRQDAISYSIPADEKVRLVQITDPHLFTDNASHLLGVNTISSLRAVLDDIIASNFAAHLMLATGDISQDYSPESYRTFVEEIKKLQLPCHYLPGNHDDPRLMHLHMQGHHIFGQKRIIIGNWQIILLDSTVRTRPGGFLSDSEMDFVEKAITICPDHYTLIAMHHNPIPAQCSWLDQHWLENGDEFLARVGQYAQVKGVLWGHIHQQLDSQYCINGHSLKLMATPSTCIQFKPKSSVFALDSLQPGYRLLELGSDGSIQSTVHRVPGELFKANKDSSGY